MNYYSSVNSHLVSRKPTFFKKGFNDNANYISSNSNKLIYHKESKVITAIRFFTVLLLFTVIGMIAYINFSYFVTVL